jgi:hypothetical protein
MKQISMNRVLMDMLVDYVIDAKQVTPGMARINVQHALLLVLVLKQWPP